MSKDDFDHLTIRRTRQGAVQGDAQERQMLDAVNDTGSFRTRIRQNADGTSTRMRTKGGMPTFYTDEVETTTPEEPVCAISMDSGVVDLQAADFLGSLPGAHDSGLLNYTDYVAGHVSSNDSAISTGPVVGKIHPPEFKGEAPENGAVAKSFDASTGRDPYDKKRISILCPPSLFTGKMRVFMQSLYGRHDHGELFQLLPSEPPSVLFDYTGQMETNAVVLDTNCGIFTDPVTCKHYMIAVGATKIKIYTMKATKCGEKLRKHLTDESVSLGDKVKIEAYILSQSHPDATTGRVVELTGFDIPTSAMGYGWHFNYDGSKCDLVHTDYVGVGLNRSIHYRISFSFNRDGGVWTATPEVIEGPVEWKHRKHDHVICYPSWDYMGMRKLGAHSAVQPYGNAPFYAFYTRDSFGESATGALASTMVSTLQVCRYSAVESTVPRGANRTPSYMNPNDALFVFGSDSYFYETWENYTNRNITVSCSDAYGTAREADKITSVSAHSGAAPDMGVVDIPYGWNNYGPSGTYYVDSGIGVPDNCTKFEVYNYYEGFITVNSMVEGLQNLGPYEQVGIYVDDIQKLGYSTGPIPSSWTDEVYTTGNWYSAKFVCVAPFYDAEAFYISSYQYLVRLESGNSYSRYGGNFWKTNATRETIGGPATNVTAYAVLGYTGYATTTVSEYVFDDRDASPPPTSSAVIVAAYGEKPATLLANAGVYFDVTDDVAPDNVEHKSSALGEAGKSQDVGINEGLSGVSLDNKPFTFVGWA